MLSVNAVCCRAPRICDSHESLSKPTAFEASRMSSILHKLLYNTQRLRAFLEQPKRPRRSRSQPKLARRRSGSGRERHAPNETDCTQSNRCKPVKSVPYQGRNQKDHSASCDDPGRPWIGPSPVRSLCLRFSIAQGNEGEATKTVVGR